MSDVSPVEPVSAGELAEILGDVAALAASRPQEEFDDDDVFDAGVRALNALGEKVTVAERRRRLTR